MVGRATFTMVESIDTMSRLRQQDPKMTILRRSLRAPTAVSMQPL
ncbi:Uncharacterised protein [Mycobacteroides abscessus subsp. abscessus]|nr:Uncharacterised protein [Mycobacteroides abscessus subsp. abscessus]